MNGTGISPYRCVSCHKLLSSAELEEGNLCFACEDKIEREVENESQEMTSPIDQIRARIEELWEIERKATPGPWTADDMSSRFVWPSLSEGQTNEDIIKIYTQNTASDQALITASRNALPGLLDALEKALGVISFVLNDGKGREIFPPSNEWPGDAYKEVEDTLAAIAETLKPCH